MINRRLEAQAKNNELHPSLKPMMRVFTIMRWVFLGTVLGIAGIFLSLYLHKPEPALLFAAGVLSVVTLFLFFVMNRILLATLVPRLERTNRLMQTTRPEPMRMHPTGVNGVQGYLVELRSQNAADDAPPWGIASVATSGRRYLSRKPQDVLVYHDPTDLKRALAVEGDTSVYWGTLTNPDDREASRRNVNRVMYMVLAMLAVLGVVFYLLMDMKMDSVRDDLRLAEQSAEWPSAQGVVTSSSVQERRIPQGRSSVQGYAAEIAYEYTVAGDVYAGGRIHFCYAPTRSFQAAKSLAARYPGGSRIAVAYNPNAPAMSVLEPGFTDACIGAQENAWREMVVIGALIILATVALLGVLWWQRSKRAQTAARLARYGIRF